MLQGGGISGLIKTVAIEYGDVHTRVVDIDINEDAQEIAELIYREVLGKDDLVEVGYKAGTRYFLQYLQRERNTQRVVDITRDSVLLLTGGARGITGYIATILAERFQPRMVLLGRSPYPKETEDSEISQALDLLSMRKVLVSREKGKSPAQIDAQARHILAAREIRSTISSIKKAGSQVEYHSIDVRDTEAFTLLINELYQRYDRIDGVIHAAGINEDKFIRHKTADSFARVFDTKVQGALTLANNLREDTRFVVFFSSIAGVVGNRGQVDYATASDALTKIALSLNQRLQGGRVVSISWGPWASSGRGEGMVSEELEALYAKRDIEVIPYADGAENLIAELCYGDKKDAYVILVQSSASKANLDEYFFGK
jgi:NAD(P)-dependent dehydrogenase (short-subunit alcohol dehydrogenase family)